MRNKMFLKTFFVHIQQFWSKVRSVSRDSSAIQTASLSRGVYTCIYGDDKRSII